MCQHSHNPSSLVIFEGNPQFIYSRIVSISSHHTANGIRRGGARIVIHSFILWRVITIWILPSPFVPLLSYFVELVTISSVLRVSDFPIYFIIGLARQAITGTVTS